LTWPIIRISKQRASVEVVFIQNYFWLTGSRQSGTELPEGLLGARFGISADAQFELSLRIPSALIAFTT
jgi:hypothetical protein